MAKKEVRKDWFESQKPPLESAYSIIALFRKEIIIILRIIICVEKKRYEFTKIKQIVYYNVCVCIVTKRKQTRERPEEKGSGYRNYT